MKRAKVFFFYSLSVLLLACTGEDETESQLTTVGDSDYRPSYHFTPEENWMNDPNGMVYYEGEYHLFFQYNPNANVWGPMHWGHAVSEDLVNWEELPIALYPDELGNIFSGSAVVDKTNSTGFKSGEEDPLVAIFTHQNPATNEQYQSLAYSNDKGRTWTKYQGNPVLVNEEKVDFRDPKVIWHEETQQWIMVIAAGQEILFYSSPDLKSWEHLQSFGSNLGAHGGVWECPDLFPVKNGNGEEKWALLVSINPGAPNGGSGTQYFLGSFDGTSFQTQQEETLWLDYGTDNYAGVTWSNEPKDRNLFIGWMSNWAYAQDVPTTKWRSAMTMPRTLRLDDNGEELISTPAEELSGIVAATGEAFSQQEEVSLQDNATLESGKFKLKASLDMSEVETTEITWGNGASQVVFSYDKTSEELLVDRSKAGFSFNNLNNNRLRAPYSLPESGKLELELWVDKSSIEVFVNGGEQVLSFLVFPNTPFGNLNITSGAEAVFIETVELLPIQR